MLCNFPIGNRIAAVTFVDSAEVAAVEEVALRDFLCRVAFLINGYVECCGLCGKVTVECELFIVIDISADVINIFSVVVKISDSILTKFNCCFGIARRRNKNH